MADVKAKASVLLEMSICLNLSQEEAAALKEMTKYGIEAFLKGYERQLGKHYIAPHKEGLRSLFKTIDKSLPSELSKLEKFSIAVNEAKNNL